MRQRLCRLVLSVLATCVPLLAETARGQQPPPEPAAAESAPSAKAKKGKVTADPEQRRRDFRQRDANKDGQLTLEEHLGKREGAQRATALATFFRSDFDGDERLSIDEFANTDPDRQPAVHSLFRLHDLDDDGQLTEDEFMRTRLGKKGEQSGRENFQKIDLNRDGCLNEREFTILPANKPDAAALFRALDGDEDGQLAMEELLGNKDGQVRRAARDTFFRLDADENGFLSQEEYQDRDPTRRMSTSSAFRQLDLDADQQLAEDEFMRLKIGKDWEQSSRQIFHRFDINHDKRLALREFAMTPNQQPSAETMFLGLDANADGELTKTEFLATFVESGQKRGSREFLSLDRNRDGKLRLSEYLQEPAEQAAVNTNDFDSVDSDANGVLTLHELSGLPEPQTDEDKDSRPFQIALMKAEIRFLAADSNGDQLLSRDEFQKTISADSAATEVEDLDAVDPTDAVKISPTARKGIATKNRDHFFLGMIVAEVVAGLAIVRWWTARQRVSRSPAATPAK